MLVWTILTKTTTRIVVFIKLSYGQDELAGGVGRVHLLAAGRVVSIGTCTLERRPERGPNARTTQT